LHGIRPVEVEWYDARKSLLDFLKESLRWVWGSYAMVKLEAANSLRNIFVPAKGGV
jgi:hypothetical protein